MSSAMYVHVPFCQQICAYCDFMRCGYFAPLAEEWLDALARELAQKQIGQVKTLYIGGGTPSALSTAQLRRLLHMLKPYTDQVQEYTIECNADSLSDEKIALFAERHVNRISMGAQTFQPVLLQKIERIADYAMIKDRIDQLRHAGISDISLDLMYGLPGQTMDQWREDLIRAIHLPITHISLYALTIEEHSRFGREHVPPCEEELEADFYEEAIALLEAHGFEQYEISSFARDGHYSQHNLSYWRYEDFYGIGCGASGKDHHQRYDNTRNLHTYLKEGSKPDVIPLSKQDEMFEAIMMGLRIHEGVNLQSFDMKFHESCLKVFHDAILTHVARGNLQISTTHLSVTKQGRMMLHEILVDFL